VDKVKLVKPLFFALVFASACLAADVTYTETSQLTGGSMKGMLNFVSRLGGNNLSKGVTSTVVVSGDKMASRSGDDGSIIDIAQGTITDVDYKGKKYAVITFAEMAAAMEQMPQAMADAKAKEKDGDVKVNVKVTTNNKGAGPAIAGASTTVFEILAETTTTVKDTKKNEEATMTSTMRMEEAMGKPQGWDTVRDFYRRMAAKMPFRADMATQMMRQAGLTVEAMSESEKKLAAMDGMAMRSVVQMIGQGEAAPQAEMPSAKDAAKAAISGIAGGFGGFGRRNNKKEETKQDKQEPAKPAGPNILLEFTTTVQSVQAGTADAQAFVIPAGFKQQDHPMKRYAQKK
jgi:hypothetical protein